MDQQESLGRYALRRIVWCAIPFVLVVLLWPSHWRIAAFVLGGCAFGQIFGKWWDREQERARQPD